MKWNGVGRVLVEHLPVEVASRPDDGGLLQFVELVEVGDLQYGIHIAAQRRVRLDPHRGIVVHPQEIPRRVRPGVQRVLPPVDGCIVPPLLGAIAEEHKVIGPIELPIPIVDHVNRNGNKVQGARFCVVQGKGIATMTVEVDPPGIHRGRVQSQLGQQGDIHLVESGLGGGNAVPLPFRQRTVLGPIVVELGRQPEGTGQEATCHHSTPYNTSNPGFPGSGQRKGTMVRSVHGRVGIACSANVYRALVIALAQRCPPIPTSL